jgi:hypothetical protein
MDEQLLLAKAYWSDHSSVQQPLVLCSSLLAVTFIQEMYSKPYFDASAPRSDVLGQSNLYIFLTTSVSWPTLLLLSTKAY